MATSRATRGIVRLAFASAVGTFVGGVLVTGWVALLNLQADDGPYFPPALVALCVVLPVTVVLLPFQVLAELSNARVRPLKWWAVEALGVTGGIAAALLLTQVIFASSATKEPEAVAGVLAFTLLQGLVTLSCDRVLAPRR